MHDKKSFQFIKIRDTRIRITSILKYGISIYVDKIYRSRKESIELRKLVNEQPLPICDPHDGMRTLEIIVAGESGGLMANYFFDCDIDIDSELKKLDDCFGL